MSKTKPQYPMSNFELAIYLVLICVICFGGLAIGIKLDYPDTKLPLHGPSLILGWGFSIFLLAYMSACQHIKTWYLQMATEAQEEQES